MGGRVVGGRVADPVIYPAMTYQALARKYRPQSFADIIGQQTVVRTLQNAIEQNRLHHAYLFSGVRGVGKTTTARILAKALNCSRGPAAEPCNECTTCSEITEGIDLDVREIDAATYTQVDNIRELREVSQFQPARDRRRIFIIDEAHMLSAGAWNALLKIIEEPPPHVVFMMATTEMQKVPATILSRVQQLALRKITWSEVRERLAAICLKEEIDAEPEALEIIARRGEGSVRDSLSLLDQVVAFSGRRITAGNVGSVLGLSGSRFFASIAGAIAAGDARAVMESLDEASEAGRDFKLLYRDFLAFIRNLLIVAAGGSERLLPGEPDPPAPLRDTAAEFDYSELLRVASLLLKDDELVTRSEQQRIAVEIALLKAATLPRLRAVESLLGGGGGERPPVRAAQREPRGASEMRRTAPASSPPDDEPERSSLPAPAGSDDLAASIASLVGAESRLAGSYLAQATGRKLEGDTLLVEFDAADIMAAGHFERDDQRAMVEQVASRAAGRPISAVFRRASPAGGIEAPASPLQSDPIVQAFARHLGGEVVPSKRNDTTEAR
jgi:DNA polymerase III subunit gamma/tau